jgi:hypothetical protein
MTRIQRIGCYLALVIHLPDKSFKRVKKIDK